MFNFCTVIKFLKLLSFDADFVYANHALWQGEIRFFLTLLDVQKTISPVSVNNND